MGTQRTRREGAALGLGLLVLFLGGCFIYDAPNPSVRYYNLTDQGLVVTILGVSDPIDQTVGPDGGVVSVVLDECIGTSMAVETETGEQIGRVDEPACPGWLLTIDKDGSLTYVEEDD